MNSLVFSNMLHRPARTAVSIIGIGIGILLIVFTVGLANGSLRERAQREANVGAEIMLRASGSLGLSGSEALRLPVSLAEDVKKVEGVATAVPIAQNSISVSDANTGSRLVDGINFDEYASVSGVQIAKGRKPADGADEVIADVAWVQQKNLVIGGKMSLYDRDFTLVGSYEPSAGGRIKIPLGTMQKQLGDEGEVSALEPDALESRDAAEVGLLIVQGSCCEHGARDDRPPARRAVARILRGEDVGDRGGLRAKAHRAGPTDRGNRDLRQLGERRVDHDIGWFAQGSERLRFEISASDQVELSSLPLRCRDASRRRSDRRDRAAAA